MSTPNGTAPTLSTTVARFATRHTSATRSPTITTATQPPRAPSTPTARQLHRQTRAGAGLPASAAARRMSANHSSTNPTAKNTTSDTIAMR
jgi:hypothetical protein